MTLIIVAILLLAYVLISTESLTNVNKAAVAIFAGTVGWVLYICYGTDFVMSQHAGEYSNFLGGDTLKAIASTSVTVKQYIARYVFLPYVGRAAEIVLFLLATMTIVEILGNNGCFDFISQLMKTRNSKKMLWILAIVTFVISANLDNLTTTVMMLTIMHRIVQSRRQRMVYGSAIVLAANCGGALTVIGNPEGLVLWTRGAVTATSFSMSLIVPCLIAWLLPTWWLGRMLPERVETGWISMPYRGDDTRLNLWQRLLMLFVGIGGLWFIPTFHDITKLSPFIGALCVLAVLWVVNEVFNRKLMQTEQMMSRRGSNVLQYGSIQMMLFVMGLMLALGVVEETGALNTAWSWITARISSLWVLGIISGLISTVLDNVATSLTFFSLAPDQATGIWQQYISQNGAYWPVIVYCVMSGGNILSIGSMAGIVLMKMERIHTGWYFKNIGWKALVGSVAGLAVLGLMI